MLIFVNVNIFFYITIVKETVSEREANEEDHVTRVVNVFKRGDCFGETEILHSIPRQSTFTATTPCELLAIESGVSTVRPSYVAHVGLLYIIVDSSNTDLNNGIKIGIR